MGNAAGGFNRGVAHAGDRVFMVTDNAHALALNRFTGKVDWETEMADWHLNYNATSAPLAVGNLIISGTAGGEQGARGFIAAYNQADGKEAWRFWNVPAPGEPGSETWKGKAYDHPSAVSWFTGTYDRELDTLYWPIGNPGPDLNGDDREGDNLYSCSVVALDPKTGKMKWYYQFTPHDTWDWDATETPMVVNANWQGQPRKLLLQGNRNGFFYVLDRVTGKLLSATPLVKNLNWATGVGADGRPILNTAVHSDANGAKLWPAFDGGTNWYSPSYNPALESVLRADHGGLQPGHQTATRNGRPDAATWAVARGPRRAKPGKKCCARSTFKPASSFGSCRNPDAAIRGEARSLQLMASSSCATIAARSWASTPRRARCSGNTR